MRRIVGLVLSLVATAAPAAAQDVNASLRAGVYADSDHTTVIRSLASVSATVAPTWTVSAREAVDLVSSASADVRASPHLDALSGPSLVAPSMSDRRFETTLGVGWDDGRGRTAGASAVYATEHDYTSAGGILRGSLDVAERNTTLVAAIDATLNHVYTIDDLTFKRSLTEIGASVGVVQVLGPGDALRLRYDVSFLDGYQASPYRAVRFGDFTTAPRPGGDGLLFLGALATLPESLPDTRLRHALVADWVHALGDSFALAVEARLAADDWGVDAATLAPELRFARGRFDGRLEARGYLQSAADFYRERYLQAPEMYAHFTSDKELGEVRGVGGALDFGWAVLDPLAPGIHLRLDLRVQVLHYEYPDFFFLSGRTSVFSDLGARLEY